MNTRQKTSIIFKSLLVLISLLINFQCELIELADKKVQQQGFELAEPIIAALGGYYEDHSYYPESLEMLVPEYIDEATLQNFLNSPDGKISGLYKLNTDSETDSYHLAFSYIGPKLGYDQCDWVLEEKVWSCWGII